MTPPTSTPVPTPSNETGIGIVKDEVALHGHRIVYRHGGNLTSDRPVLLLVHGMAGSSATWNAVIPRLSERYRVIAPDLPGHGESDKPRQDYSLGAHANALRDLMIALGTEKATIVGQSLGGGIAMQLAYQHPQQCERLVLVSSGGLGPDVSWMLRLLTLPGAEFVMPIIFPSFIRDAGNAISQRLARSGIRWPHVEQEWRAYVSLAQPENRQSFVKTLRAVVDPRGQSVSAHDRLYLAAHLPTLIVWGERDRIIPVAHAHAAQAAIPDARLVIFEESGHFAHWEEPERFAATLTEFVEDTTALDLDESEWRALLMAGTAAGAADH